MKIIHFVLVILFFSCHCGIIKKEKKVTEKSRVIILPDKSAKPKLTRQSYSKITNDIIEQLYEDYEVIDEEAQQKALKQLKAQQLCGKEDCDVKLSKLFSADYNVEIEIDEEKHPNAHVNVTIIIYSKEGIIVKFIYGKMRESETFKYNFADIKKEEIKGKALVIKGFGSFMEIKYALLLEYLLNNTNYAIVDIRLSSNLKQDIVQSRKCYSENCTIEIAEKLDSPILELFTDHWTSYYFRCLLYNPFDGVIWKVLVGEVIFRDYSKLHETPIISFKENLSGFDNKKLLALSSENKKLNKDDYILYVEQVNGTLLTRWSFKISQHNGPVIANTLFEHKINELKERKKCSPSTCIQEVAKQLSIKYLYEIKEDSQTTPGKDKYSVRLKNLYTNKEIIAGSGVDDGLKVYSYKKEINKYLELQGYEMEK
jgi:hypothetical protein